MALGTFSGGGLGMGVAFVLEDYFSKTADTIERRMGQLGNYTEQMSDKIDRAMNQIKIGAAMTAMGSAILAPFVSGIKNASDLEENINKNRVAFGAYSAEVEAFANKSLDTFGVDKIQALDMTSLFGDMSTGMGMGQEQASKMAMSLVGLAGDLSSFKNISSEMSQTALKGIFTGEAESLKNLGIVMTEANLESYMASQGINKNFKDLSQTEKVMTRFNFVMAMSKNAIGDFARTSDGYANSKRIFEGSIKEVSATLGEVLMPIAAKAFQAMSGLMKGLKDFAQTPIGKNILIGVAALGAFLVVGGLALILIGGTRFAVYKMADAFGASTKAKIIDTIVTKGLSAGLREMGVAAWASLGPYVLIAAAIAAFAYVAKQAWDMVESGNEKMVRFGTVIFWLLGPIGWIIWAIVGIKRGFKDLSEGNVNQGGILGFFTKVAGVIEAVGEIWNSFNGETFTLSEELASKLEAMGILDFVINLGTWISRIKMFFDGFVTGLSEGFEVVKRTVGGVWDRLTEGVSKIFDKLGGIWDKLKTLFAPVIDLIGQFLEYLGFGKGSLDDWGSAGELLGNIFMFALNNIITVIGWVIDAILWVIDAWLSVVDAVITGVQWIVDGIMWIVDGIIGWIDLMFSLGSMAYDIGANFMTNLWEGLKAVWEGVWNWLEETVGGAISLITDAIGLTDSENPDDKDKPVGKGGGGGNQPRTAGMQSKGMQGHHFQSSKSPTVFNTNNNQQNQNNAGPTVVQMYMDGDMISEKVIEKQELKKARG